MAPTARQPKYRTRDARDVANAALALRHRAERLEQLADLTDQALDKLARESATLGWAERGEDAHVSTSRGDTLVERHAGRAAHLQGLRDQIAAEVRAIVEHAEDRHAADGLEFAIGAVWRGERPPERPVSCCDNQVGKHGAERWGDPLCHMPPVKAGLCQRHYMAWYRARQDDGIDTSRDFQPA